MILKNKVAVVTGAGRGIGYDIAKCFLKEGAKVFVCDNVEERLKKSVNMLSSLGKIDGRVVDISERTEVEDLINDVINVYSRIDILVNNAGVGKSTPFLELTDEAWDKVMNVNLKGAFYCCQEVLKVMVNQKSGIIINIGSTNGMRGQPTMAHYNSSKAGLISLTQTLAVEFAEFGVRVNCLCPGSIATELNIKESGWDAGFLERLRNHIPMKRFGQPEDIGWSCAFLASDYSHFMTGQTMVVDGGMLAQQ